MASAQERQSNTSIGIGLHVIETEAALVVALNVRGFGLFASQNKVRCCHRSHAQKADTEVCYPIAIDIAGHRYSSCIHHIVQLAGMRAERLRANESEGLISGQHRIGIHPRKVDLITFGAMKIRNGVRSRAGW